MKLRSGVQKRLRKSPEGEVLKALRDFGDRQQVLLTIDPHQFPGIQVNPRTNICPVVANASSLSSGFAAAQSSTGCGNRSSTNVSTFWQSPVHSAPACY